MDRKVKPLLYAEAGIESYWRFVFEPAPRLVVGELKDGAYADVLTAEPVTLTRLTTTFPRDVDPATLTRQ
ncbi:hypothetical protein AB0F18_14515 [Streptomyces sp. NPDC029216]|uniref:hypothetical protein n=1 Tax=Streptomyces sp. NPDC029216 TaxID=3154701 RepID=UPI0033D4AE5F